MIDIKEELDRIEELPVSARMKLDLTRRILRLYAEAQREAGRRSTSDGRGPQTRSA
jgi:hypothetical protein